MAIRRPVLVPRMAEHATSVFAEMTALAIATGSVNLGQGFPDTDGPIEVREAARRAIAEGRGNQYPPFPGVPELREAIVGHQHRFYGIELDPATDVVVTTGASEALAATLLALVDDGDEVVVFEPSFDVYAAMIALAGGVRRSVPMSGPELRPDLNALAEAVTPRTRMILLNSPHNPTGVVLTRDELDTLVRIAVANDVLVLADEAYEHLWFDGTPHIPVSTLPGMAERTVTVGSGGKMFSLTGWKVGWATGPAELIGAVKAVRQHLSFVSGGPFQYAMAVGLGLADSYFDDFRLLLQSRKDRLTEGLSATGMRVLPSNGTYYVTTDITSLGYDDGLAFCRDLPQRAGVVAIPHQVFCEHPEVGRPYVRWAFCKTEAVLDEAIDRLVRAFP